jgi:hypothetical protein
MKYLLLILLSSPVLAHEPAEFYIGEGLSIGMIAVDWKTTRGISNRDGHYERNMILGKRPSPTKVDIYMATCVVAHVILAKKLPRHWRYALWGVTVGFQGYVMWNKHKNGTKIF